MPKGIGTYGTKRGRPKKKKKKKGKKKYWQLLTEGNALEDIINQSEHPSTQKITRCTSKVWR